MTPHELLAVLQRMTETPPDPLAAEQVIAAALTAGRAEALAILARLEEWTHVMGAALKPRGADTYGEGMRDAKEQVSHIIRAPSPTAVAATGTITVSPTQWMVSVLPSTHPEYSAFAVVVERRIQRDGSHRWAVMHMGSALRNDGSSWDIEPTPSSRDTGWIGRHRWLTREAAVGAAMAAAPFVAMNGVTAEQVANRSPTLRQPDPEKSKGPAT